MKTIFIALIVLLALLFIFGCTENVEVKTKCSTLLLQSDIQKACVNNFSVTKMVDKAYYLPDNSCYKQYDLSSPQMVVGVVRQDFNTEQRAIDYFEKRISDLGAYESITEKTISGYRAWVTNTTLPGGNVNLPGVGDIDRPSYNINAISHHVLVGDSIIEVQVTNRDGSLPNAPCNQQQMEELTKVIIERIDQ